MADAPKERIRVAVVGGGIAGLTAALRLAERGFEVRVMEDRMYLGGKLGSHRHQIQERLVDRLKPEELAQLRELQTSAAPDCVPAFVLDWIEAFLAEQAAELAGRPASPMRVDRVTARPCEALHGSKKEWQLDCECGGRTFRFHLSIYRRGDQAERVLLADDAYHEHCYHMYLNWYGNFWDVMRDIGREKTQYFAPLNHVTHLFPGIGPVSERQHRLRGLSSIQAASDNLLSGAEPVPDMFLWFYSAVDLVSHPLNSARYLDRISVHAFMRSRWYESERSVRFHENLLSKAFAVPTYYSSAFAYRRYIEYSLAQPEPMLWVLRDNTYNGLFEAFESALARRGGSIERGVCVTALSVDTEALSSYRWTAKAAPRVTSLKFKFSGARGAARYAGPDESEAFRKSATNALRFEPDYVVLAVPPVALADLLTWTDRSEESSRRIREKLPSLASVRKLRSGATAALDLYFTRPIDVPQGHVVLRDSRLGLTFIDNSCIWEKRRDREAVQERPPATNLLVAATDFYKIEGMDKDSATRLIIEDLKRYLDFEDQDIDLSRTYLQFNDRDPLFLNEAGTEPWRPATTTEIPNLFIAGDYCDTEIGIVSVESAVVSGLRAARAVQAQARADRGLLADAPELREIPIVLPETYPIVNADALKLILTPHAIACKAWSRAIDLAAHPERGFTPAYVNDELADAVATPAAVALDLAKFAADAAQWFAELPYGGDR